MQPIPKERKPMTDKPYELELDLTQIMDFKVGETFDLSKRIIDFVKLKKDNQTKELMLEILDHINSLYQIQNLMMKEYNKTLSELASVMEGINGNS
jgi:hypothetical protein